LTCLYQLPKGTTVNQYGGNAYQYHGQEGPSMIQVRCRLGAHPPSEPAQDDTQDECCQEGSYDSVQQSSLAGQEKIPYPSGYA
jgi:hypothetical protein